MKAALMTEASVIPGVALFNSLNPESKFIGLLKELMNSY